MIDYKPQIQESLGDILPTYYEFFCDSSTEKPCITYAEYENYIEVQSDTMDYSYI